MYGDCLSNKNARERRAIVGVRWRMRTKNDCPSIKRVEIRPIVPRYVTAASSKDAEYAREKEVKGRSEAKTPQRSPLARTSVFSLLSAVIPG
jgi:hypothetical protein